MSLTKTNSIPKTISDSKKNYPTVKVINSHYAYQYSRFSPKEQILLLDNLPKLEKSEVIFQKNNCRLLTSTSFYTQNLRHIGLFQINDSQITPKQSNALFIGFLSKTPGQFRIERDFQNHEQVQFALQSGPLLLENGDILALSLKVDKPSRRIFFAIDDKGDGILGAIFDPNFTDNGPLLTDLATILKEISDQEHLNIQNAINLDGGRHSLYKTNAIDLFETSPAGGFFCLK